MASTKEIVKWVSLNPCFPCLEIAQREWANFFLFVDLIDKLLGVAKQLLVLHNEASEDLLLCARLHLLLEEYDQARSMLLKVMPQKLIL